MLFNLKYMKIIFFLKKLNNHNTIRSKLFKNINLKFIKQKTKIKKRVSWARVLAGVLFCWICLDGISLSGNHVVLVIIKEVNIHS